MSRRRIMTVCSAKITVNGKEVSCRRRSGHQEYLHRGNVFGEKSYEIQWMELIEE